MHVGLCILGFGMGTLDFRFRISIYGLRILDGGLWPLGIALWVLDFWGWGLQLGFGTLARRIGFCIRTLDFGSSVWTSSFGL